MSDISREDADRLLAGHGDGERARSRRCGR